MPNSDDGVFVMYEYVLKTGERHRNVEYARVRDGRLVETQVYSGGQFSARRRAAAPPRRTQAEGRPTTRVTTSSGSGTSPSSAAALAGKSNTPSISCTA